MLLVYASRTNNVSRIVGALRLGQTDLLDISNGYDGEVNRRFILLTYTDLLGAIPQVVSDFLVKNSELLAGVAGSGNRNFGNNFCGAARKISAKYGVPLVATFELSGNDEEISKFRKFLEEN